MPGGRMWVIADDLTGAADSGIAFAGDCTDVFLELVAGSDLAAGLPVGDGLSANDQRLVYVLDTNTRESGPAQARDAIRRATSGIQPEDDVFKKVDSLFRGEVGVELTAMREALSERLFLICPAVPAHGRSVRNGLIEFTGADESVQVSGRDVAELLGDLSCTGTGLEAVRAGGSEVADAISHARSAGTDGIVFDAETDDDLDRIVAGARSTGFPIAWVGAAGLAAAVARTSAGISKPRSTARRLTVSRALIVVGSHSTLGRRQADRLSATGITSVEIDADSLIDYTRAELDVLATELANVASLASVVISVTGDVRSDRKADVADAFAHISGRAVRDSEAVIISGGATARAVLAQAGITSMQLLDELYPGVILSHAETGLHELHVVTKSGSFGDENTLVRLLAALTRTEG